MSKSEKLPPDEEELMGSVIDQANPEFVKKAKGKPEDSIEKQVRWEMEEHEKRSDEIIKERERVRENELKIALGKNPKLQSKEGKELAGEILEGINKSNADTRTERITEIKNWTSSGGTGAKKKLEEIFNSWEQADKAQADVPSPKVSTENKISYWEKIYNDKMAGEDMRKSALERLEKLRKNSESDSEASSRPRIRVVRPEADTPEDAQGATPDLEALPDLEAPEETTNIDTAPDKKSFLKKLLRRK
jgi:hypothetical protein